MAFSSAERNRRIIRKTRYWTVKDHNAKKCCLYMTINRLKNQKPTLITVWQIVFADYTAQVDLSPCNHQWSLGCINKWTDRQTSWTRYTLSMGNICCNDIHTKQEIFSFLYFTFNWHPYHTSIMYYEQHIKQKSSL